MQTRLNPYLNFKDNARQAMEFYKKIFGGKLDMQTFKDFHASEDPSEDDKIMHAMLETDNDLTFMAADTPNSMEYQGHHGFGVSLSGDNENELRSYFDQLSSGGKISMPLEKASWGDIFGMVTDKFGITWLVDISATK